MKLSLKLECLLLFCLAALTGWADAIQGSTTDPASGRPEHRYILANSQGYYVNKIWHLLPRQPTALFLPCMPWKERQMPTTSTT